MQERVDVAGAVAGWASARSNGSNVTLSQFIPNWSRELMPRQSADQMMAAMRGIQKRLRKRGKSKK